jgi:DUF4097 and DUF4098 domain-containing protein YvlB
MTYRHRTIAAVFLFVAISGGFANATTRAVDERRSAEPRGSVEIINTSGRITVTGWDRSEVAITGTLQKDVERMEFTSSGSKTVIRVVPRKKLLGNSNSGEAILSIQIPQQSSLNVSSVSADLVVRQVLGEQRLSTVSGNIDAELGAEASARSVSGDMRLVTKPETKRLEIKSVSGDVNMSGGASGLVDVKTVSGDGKFLLGTLADASFKTVSGDFELKLGLDSDGRVTAESVSGLIAIDFASLPAARFKLRTFSGNIDLCALLQPAAGAPPTNRAERRNREFQIGDGEGRVDVQTMSGEVRLCSLR